MRGAQASGRWGRAHPAQRRTKWGTGQGSQVGWGWGPHCLEPALGEAGGGFTPEGSLRAWSMFL